MLVNETRSPEDPLSKGARLMRVYLRGIEFYLALSLVNNSRAAIESQWPKSYRGHLSDRAGSFGNSACGSVWYQYATEATSSASGWYLPVGHQPKA